MFAVVQEKNFRKVLFWQDEMTVGNYAFRLNDQKSMGVGERSFFSASAMVSFVCVTSFANAKCV